MSKDHEWEARHQEGQIAIEKVRKEEEKKRREDAEREGRICSRCNTVIEYKDMREEIMEEKENFNGPIGGGVHATIVKKYKVKIMKCPKCGWERDFSKEKVPDNFDKFVKWLKDLFS